MTVRLDPKTGEWVGTTGGVDLKELDSRKPKAEFAKEAKRRKTQEEIHAQNMADPQLAFCYKLGALVAQEYGFDLKVSFRNLRGADHFMSRDRKRHYIRVGYEAVDWLTTKGMVEYYTIGYIWRKHGFETSLESDAWNGKKAWRVKSQGLKALWMMMLHELAHALQWEDDGRPYGEQHNEVFVEKLDELITLFPFEEVIERLSKKAN